LTRKGYTLIELMVALVIVAILATITYSYGSKFLKNIRCGMAAQC
jgi:prepilin-type N-terminal cleavage/methylation domain-containing protein